MSIMGKPVAVRPPRPLAVAGLPHDALELRESLRASRLTLRVDPGRDVIQVVVPVLGVDHVIRHAAGFRGATHRGANEIRVGGEPEFVARRVRDFLIKESRDELARRAKTKASVIGKRVAAVTVRDTRSRWGSCASSGRLSFSWRLILTPEPVFDYVVAHEVAHLREMNHSARFWALVATLTPEVEVPRAWLKANGARLLRFG